jgi:hypothetical protein
MTWEGQRTGGGRNNWVTAPTPRLGLAGWLIGNRWKVSGKIAPLPYLSAALLEDLRRRHVPWHSACSTSSAGRGDGGEATAPLDGCEHRLDTEHM